MTKKTLKLFLSHISRYRGITFLLLASVVVSNLIDVIVPLFYKNFFDTLASAAISAHAAVQVLITTLFAILGLRGATWVLHRVIGFTNTWYQSRIMTDLEQTSFNYLIHHSHRFFINHFTGSLVRKVHRMARGFEDISDQIQSNLLPLVVTAAGILVVLFRRDFRLGLALLVWTVFFIAINYFIARWKQKYDVEKAATDSETTGVLADALTNNINIKLFSAFAFEKLLYKKATEKLHRVRRIAWGMNELLDAVQALLMIAIEFGLLYIAVRLWQNGRFTIGDFVLLQVYLIELFSRLWAFGRIIRRVYEGFADAEEMTEILSTEHELQDVQHAKNIRVTEGRIEFQDVSFSFQKTRKILERFNLTIEPEEKIALVGPSGAGKSTIASLLTRLYDLGHGRILIDGENIAQVTQKSLRENLSLVPQDPILFHRTIAENIRYGRRGASMDDIVSAAKKAHCDEFINDLPDGYQTYVGERGVKLSGGERQRVAIARAVLKSAPILILDEATSSLDSKSESLIQDALKSLIEGKTVIVIAHRLSTIMQMNRIIVLKDGKIAEEGSHAELLNKDGIYQQLWNIQSGGFIG